LSASPATATWRVRRGEFPRDNRDQ
jgi:hypothetical protein